MSVQMIDVIEVSPADQDRLGGMAWADAVKAGGGTARVPFWNFSVIERDEPGWVVPTDRAGKPTPFLPLGRSWLRETKGRAFLYFQNWTANQPMPKSRHAA